MTNSTRLFGLIMFAALLTAAAHGQELPLPGLDEPVNPSDLSLPSLGADQETLAPGAASDEQSMVAGSSSAGGETFDGIAPSGEHEYDQFDPGMHDFWAQHGAPIESTGTWMRRGFWYAEAEAVIWNRHWNRDNKFFAVDDINVLIPGFFPRAPNFAGQEPAFNTNRLLMLDGSEPGEDASVRFTLGHFLFRDSRNRDHTIDFTALGGGDWHQHRVLSSVGNFGLFVPFYISGSAAVIEDGQIVDVVGNRTFNASTRQEIDYSSNFSSFECNYRVEQRPGRDQMIMDANGHWHRATQRGFSKDYLIGLRFMEMRDILNWRAEDIQVIGNDGSYLIRTDNDMFGLQMGAGLTYDTARWSLGYHIKGGVFLNNATGRSTLDFTADDTNDADLGFSADELSFIGEAKLIARWHLLPDFSLRASYEMMYLTSQAVAPNQATFISDYSYLNTTQDPFYHGASFGFEGYW